MQLDSNVVDLLLSRLLHDLIGPVTATASGIELIEEFSQGTNDIIAQEALALASASARQTAGRLSYFRLAFGGGGNGDGHRLGTVRRLAEDYLSSRKIDFKFTTDSDDYVSPAAGVAKTVLATVFMLADTLPRSGRIEVEINAAAGWLATVSAIGSGAAIEDAGIASLLGTASSSSLTTNTVIGAMIRESATQFALTPETHAETDLVTVTLRPAGQLGDTLHPKHAELGCLDRAVERR